MAWFVPVQMSLLNGKRVTKLAPKHAAAPVNDTAAAEPAKAGTKGPAKAPRSASFATPRAAAARARAVRDVFQLR